MSTLDDLFDRMEDEYENDWLYSRSRHSRAVVGEVCKFCSKTGLKWRETDDGWRLIEAERSTPGNRNVLHNCRSQPANPDEFDTV